MPMLQSQASIRIPTSSRRAVGYVSGVARPGLGSMADAISNVRANSIRQRDTGVERCERVLVGIRRYDERRNEPGAARKYALQRWRGPSTLASHHRKTAQSNGAEVAPGGDYVEGGAVGREIGVQGDVLRHHRIGHVLANGHRRDRGRTAPGRA